MNEMFVTSFVLILNQIAKERFICDSSTQLSELFEAGLDGIDFEIAITAFEATNRLIFESGLWSTPVEEYLSLSVGEFMERFMKGDVEKNPLYITNRLLDLRESIESNLAEEAPEA